MYLCKISRVATANKYKELDKAFILTLESPLVANILQRSFDLDLESLELLREISILDPIVALPSKNSKKDYLF